MRILVAEDDLTSRTILSGILRKWGYDPLTVADGEAAWQVMGAPDAPKLAILDWDMPGLSGPEVCARVRASRDTVTPPYLIILTAKDDKTDIVIGLDAGANDYVTKPYDNSELQARIRVGVRMVELQDELLAARQALVYEAMHDALTGVYSRRAILELLDKELVGSIRRGKNLSIGLCDIDFFKKINDTYGHLVGDEVLRGFARAISASLRENDHFGRIGGEEFLVVAPDWPEVGGENLYERLRRIVAELSIDSGAGPLRITMSVGVAFVGEKSSANSLLAAADEAMYAAKAGGRNRVVFASRLASRSGETAA
jgi:two-component system, cell cycle response regulator